MRWSKKFPLLAKRTDLRVDRVTFTKLVAPTESLAIAPVDGASSDAAGSAMVRHEMMTRVLKRLLSNEAGPTFLHDVPAV